MFEAPAFAFALIAICAVAQGLYRMAGELYVVDAIVIAQTVMTAIGFAEIRACTHGAARQLATLAILGGIVVVAMMVVRNADRDAIDIDVFLWISFVASSVVTVALVVAAGHIALAITTIVAQLVAHPVPALVEWRALDWRILGLATWGVIALRVVLAMLATRGRRAPARRWPFGPVAIGAVLVAIAQLVPGIAVDVVAWLVLAIAAWRLARVVAAPLALAASGIAWVAAGLAAMDRYWYIDAYVDRGALALALVAIAIAARLRMRRFIAGAIVVAALVPGAILFDDVLARACIGAAALITAIVTIRGGRMISAMPGEPTVEEVFA
jgi:hypothetical protein